MATRLPTNPHPIGLPPEAGETFIRDCTYCGHEFRSTRDWQKFGNHDCQQTYWKMIRGKAAELAKAEIS